ncbi:Protein of unknown function [Bacillus wiedmannii]|nr:Protein of unknown function [Bacillus wiedmannii]
MVVALIVTSIPMNGLAETAPPFTTKTVSA